MILKKLIRSLKMKNLFFELKTNKEYNYLLLFFFKYHFLTQLDCLVDIVVVDKPNKKARFTIIYSLLSFTYNNRFFVKIVINELSKVFSLYSIFSGSNWYEREVWDMFGIFFKNHPDLRRILTDYNFKGFPLKKDFPLTGFLEVFYSTIENNLFYKSVKLTQAYRVFLLEKLCH